MGTVLIHRVNIMTERGKKIGYPVTLLQLTVLMNDRKTHHPYSTTEMLLRTLLLDSSQTNCFSYEFSPSNHIIPYLLTPRLFFVT